MNTNLGMKISTSALRALQILIFILIPLCFAQAKKLSEISKLSAGAPTILGRKLGPNSYITVEAQKLNRARVVWVNWDYLRKAGYEVADEQMTPEIERAMLDAFAWGVRAPGEPASAFSETEKKIFYADRYGGDGLAGNMGSGRAASAGDIQIKGIGKTDLVTTIGPSHSNGTAEMQEAIREALYGEVGQVLPYGANRVIAIIDRGTQTKFESGYVQQNALIIREDSLRSAHYMKNLWGRGPLMASENIRTQEALKYFLRGFPVPANLKQASAPEKIRGALLAYADRIANAYAAAFTLKIYHGATSVSNIEASGRFIDYGTLTTLPDYGKTKIIEINDPNGEITEFKEILMLEFLRNVRDNLPKNLATRVPTDDEMTTAFENAYNEHLHHHFLRLTGLSEAEISRLEKTPESYRLTEFMLRVATDGAKTIMDPHDSASLTQYNLNRIIVKFVQANSLNPEKLMESIRNEMRGPGSINLRRDLISSYISLMAQTNENRAEMLARAQDINAQRTSAYRWDMYGKADSLTAAYIKSQDPKEISNGMNQLIREVKTPSKTISTCREVFN